MPKLGILEAADGRKVTLGSTEVTSGHVTPYSSVECDQITACIASLLQSACEPDRQTAFSRALGRVVAHELYHILARTRRHTPAGVSRALQSPFDLIKEHFQLDKQALVSLRGAWK
jgi:ubiquinone biosynthesis protein UbiJ